MKRFTRLTCAITLAAMTVAVFPASADAGPLLDWLRRTCGCKQGCGVPAAPAAYAGMPVAAANPNCGFSRANAKSPAIKLVPGQWLTTFPTRRIGLLGNKFP